MEKLNTRTFFLVILMMDIVGPVCQAQYQTPQIECGNKESLLSTNKTLTPPQQIVASGVASHKTANWVLNFGSAEDLETLTWCTLSTDEERYITIHFSCPVLITAMLSSGTTEERDGFQTFHVTNFTVDYLTKDNDTVTYSTQTENPKYFASPQLNTFIKFEEPFLAQNIRFNVIEWYDSEGPGVPQFVCLGVAIFGCLESDAVPSKPPTTTPLATTSTTDDQATSCTTDAKKVMCDCSNQTSATLALMSGGDQSLTIVLPIVVVMFIIAVLLILATVGVVSYRYYVTRKKGNENTEQRRPILLHTMSSRSQDSTDGGTIRKVSTLEFSNNSVTVQENEGTVTTLHDQDVPVSYEELFSNSDRTDSMELNMSPANVQSTEFTENPAYDENESNTNDQSQSD